MTAPEPGREVREAEEDLGILEAEGLTVLRNYRRLIAEARSLVAQLRAQEIQRAIDAQAATGVTER